MSSTEPPDFPPLLGLHLHLECESTRRLRALWDRYMVLHTQAFSLYITQIPEKMINDLWEGIRECAAGRILQRLEGIPIKIFSLPLLGAACSGILSLFTVMVCDFHDLWVQSLGIC